MSDITSREELVKNMMRRHEKEAQELAENTISAQQVLHEIAMPGVILNLNHTNQKGE